ncbi:MAG: UDP-glucose 4-epimerase GalE [Coriobacteriia bacterium]|nr:UDP-glucose 4-epimerase GalE [Coriobacteriia bacterium]
MSNTILVTGGAGYIGSHTVVELLDNGYEVIVVDDLSNSSIKSIERIKKITGKDLKFYEFNLLDMDKLNEVFDNHKIDAIIHFAGYKAVGESVEKPLEYYVNNLMSSFVLCDVARNHNCKNLIFSSSATVYGDPQEIPISENCPKGNPTNPYGQTKSMQEQIFSDLCVSDSEWNIVLLRYFNPIGAHKSGLIGEDPKGIPNNLVPYVAQVAVGKLDSVGVFGNDYDTPDGTGVRDYIHVVDLAQGHVAALNWMDGKHGVEVFNLGTGRGYSVLEVIDAFSHACGHKISYDIKPRRAGDIATCYADPSKAKEILGWSAKYDIKRMCEDSWRWQSSNPNGYEE